MCVYVKEGHYVKTSIQFTRQPYTFFFFFQTLPQSTAAHISLNFNSHTQPLSSSLCVAFASRRRCCRRWRAQASHYWKIYSIFWLSFTLTFFLFYFFAVTGNNSCFNNFLSAARRAQQLKNEKSMFGDNLHHNVAIIIFH